MTTKIVYQLDENGVFTGTTEADESPREPGVYLIPAGCIEVEPPPHVDGKLRVFRNDAWAYVDIELAPAAPDEPLPSLDDMKRVKLAKLNQLSQAIADQLTAGYPEFEKLTWDDQRREAMAWQADNTVATTYIDALAANREIDRVDYLKRTVAKITAFTAAAQKLVGQRQKYEDQIKAADSPEALDAIEFIFNLE